MLHDLIGNERHLAHEFEGTFRSSNQGTSEPGVMASWTYVPEAREEHERLLDPKRQDWDIENIASPEDELEDVGMGYVRVHAQQGQQVYELLRLGPASAIRLYRQACPLLESEEERAAAVHILALLTRSVRQLVREGAYSRAIFADTDEGNWEKPSNCLQVLQWFAQDTQKAKGCPFAKGILRALGA